MDKNLAAFLRTNLKTVSVRFFQDPFVDKRGGDFAPSTLLGDDAIVRMSTKAYTYITDLELKMGDLVVVYVQGIPKVVVVDTAHSDLQIQPNEDTAYKWIVAKVDTSQYQKNLLLDMEITKTVSASYTQNVRKQFQNMLLTQMDEESKNKVLALVEGKTNDPS